MTLKANCNELLDKDSQPPCSKTCTDSLCLKLPEEHTCQDYLARYKDQQHDLGHQHSVDETRKQLWLILQVYKTINDTKSTVPQGYKLLKTLPEKHACSNVLFHCTGMLTV